MGTRGEARLVPAVTMELRTEHLDFLLWAASSHCGLLSRDWIDPCDCGWDLGG